MIAGGKGPDIMQVAENVNVYSSKNQLLPLDDLAKKAGLDLAQRFGSIGEHLLVPGQGLRDPGPLRRDDRVLQQDPVRCQGHQGADGGLDLGRRPWPRSRSSPSPASSGATPVAAGGPSGGASSTRTAARSSTTPASRRSATDEVIEALQWAGDLVFKHGVVPTKKQYADMGADVGGDGAFANGKVAVNTTGFWAISGLAKTQDRVGHRAAVARQAAGRDAPSAAGWPSPGRRRTPTPRSRRSTSSPRPRRSRRSSPPARTCRPASRCRRATRSSSPPG